MALPLGKLTILIGAGVLGSILAKEGRMPSVSDFVSGAFKMALKPIRQDDSTPSVRKPRNEGLLAQVDSLRQELQSLASNRPITIVTASGTGGHRYGVIIVVVVVGYGYVWWKGWKLPNMMFATRQSLSDASVNISKKLENVYSLIGVFKQKLCVEVDKVDKNLLEVKELSVATDEQVSELRDQTNTVSVDVQTFRRAVENLETKINTIEGKQDLTNRGVKRLCDYAWNLEHSRAAERIQASPSSSSRPALERPPLAHSLTTGSLPSTVLSLEPPSPSGSSGLHQEGNGILELMGPSGGPEVSNEPSVSEGTNDVSSRSGLFGAGLPSSRPSFVRRTISLTNSFRPSTKH